MDGMTAGCHEKVYEFTPVKGTCTANQKRYNWQSTENTPGTRFRQLSLTTGEAWEVLLPELYEIR